jgi:hypothetical protein
MESCKLAVVYLAYLEQQRNASKTWPVAPAPKIAPSPPAPALTTTSVAAGSSSSGS